MDPPSEGYTGTELWADGGQRRDPRKRSNPPRPLLAPAGDVHQPQDRLYTHRT